MTRKPRKTTRPWNSEKIYNNKIDVFGAAAAAAAAALVSSATAWCCYIALVAPFFILRCCCRFSLLSFFRSILSVAVAQFVCRMWLVFISSDFLSFSFVRPFIRMLLDVTCGVAICLGMHLRWNYIRSNIKNILLVFGMRIPCTKQKQNNNAASHTHDRVVLLLDNF